MAQQAQALLNKLTKGDDCEKDARQLVESGVSVPDVLVLATFGNRSTKVQPCPKVLRALLEGRANPHAVDPVTKGPAIHTACWHGTVDVVKVLLEFRANINAIEDNMKTPPLNTALAAGNAKVCLELLNRNADVQWTHHDGATALHVATAWIASSHNSNLRLPPVGEEPVAVIHQMLHNGVDPLQTEGMTKTQGNRAKGMTPLESFRREIARSPWRSDESIGPKFDKTAKLVHTILEQGEEALTYKKTGNKAFGENKLEDALKAYDEARRIWEKANIRGHHIAVLWSNTAACHKKKENFEQCIQACNEGLTHYCTSNIRSKLEKTLKEATEEAERRAKDDFVPEPKPVVQKNPPTKLDGGFLGEKPPENALYGPEGSTQGKVENPGPFICNFDEAREAGYVDGVDGWKDRAKREEQELDQELVRKGLMSPELLDDPKTVEYINRLPPGTG